jgi:hypothetical protein
LKPVDINREALKEQARVRGLSNLRFEPFMPVERLSKGLAQGHIHLAHQNPTGAAFAMPSKILFDHGGRPALHLHR